MDLLCTFLWVTLVTFAAADDSCPAPEELSPCTCDGEGLNCMNAKNPDDIRRAFKANFKYGGVRSVWVQGTPLTSIPADLFGNVKSQQYYVEVNNVTEVDIKAFSGSKKTLRTLSLYGNKLASIDYSGLSIYENLGILNLGRNQITSIPDNAFNSRSLGAIILAMNQINHIGPNAFANLPSLSKLEMSINQIQTLGPMSLASKVHSSGLQIGLSSNKISSVSSTAFEGTDPYAIFLSGNKLTSLPYDSFGNLITRIGQKGGFIDVTGNPLDCRGCDYSWIVLNKDVLQAKLVGFRCNDGKSIAELTKSGIGCNS